MTGGAQTRPSGVVVTSGSARPAAEGGVYMHYANMSDFFNDWTYLIAGHGYNCAGKQDINAFTLGLFTQGGAAYNYAAVGYAGYAPQMSSIRNGVNGSNGGYLDALDQAWKDGTLGEGYGGQGESSEPSYPVMAFRFNIKDDPDNWNPGTVYLYNGAINEIQGIHNSEEHKYIQEIFKDCTGRELFGYTWEKGKSEYKHLFALLNPGSQSKQIQDTLDKIIKELEEAVQ